MPGFCRLPRRANLLIRPEHIPLVLEKSDTVPGLQSQRLARILTAHFPAGEIHIHRPSLVQHIATDSAWGMPMHRAGDFGK